MQIFKFVVFLAAVVAVKAVKTVVLNNLVDDVLASANELLSLAGKATVSVSHIGTDWHEKWHFIKVSGSLTCDNGYVGQLNTLKRTGNASMTTSSNTAIIKAQLGVGNLSFHFDSCTAKVNHLPSVSSKVDGNIDSDSVSFQLSLSYEPNKTCSASLDSISLDNIGKIDLKTGAGIFHKVVDKLLNLIANHLRGDVKNDINKRLVPVAQAAVIKNSQKICQRIPR